eukprot:1972400-Amphidinium_carterae.1
MALFAFGERTACPTRVYSCEAMEERWSSGRRRSHRLCQIIEIISQCTQEDEHSEDAIEQVSPSLMQVSLALLRPAPAMVVRLCPSYSAAHALFFNNGHAGPCCVLPQQTWSAFQLTLSAACVSEVHTQDLIRE